MFKKCLKIETMEDFKMYIHRSGRTARASASGKSILLIDPKSADLYRKLCRMLNRGVVFENWYFKSKVDFLDILYFSRCNNKFK